MVTYNTRDRNAAQSSYLAFLPPPSPPPPVLRLSIRAEICNAKHKKDAEGEKNENLDACVKMLWRDQSKYLRVKWLCVNRI